jgi:predicted nucleotidyltransferase
MKEDERLLAGFVEGASKLDCVQSIYLFGSLATGEYDAESDMDLLVIVERPRSEDILPELAEIIVDLPLTRDVQPVVTNLYDLDPDFVAHAVSTGVLVFGEPVHIRRGMPEVPATLVRYAASGLPATDRTRLSRLVHGYRSVKRRKGRTYSYRYSGIRDRRGVQVLGPGALLLPPWEARELTRFLDSVGAEYKLITVRSE